MNLYVAIEDITFYIAIEASTLEHCKIFLFCPLELLVVLQISTTIPCSAS